MVTILFSLSIIAPVCLLPDVSIAEYQIPASITTVTGLDGTVWEQVNQPGFGSDNNMSVTAMAEYQGRLYAMTRNEVEGVEVWRTTGTGWEQVLFPDGVTNGVYGNTFLNNLWGAMKVFQGKLYFGFSSGLQGSVLKSTGCEIWRYDGTTWEPVISDRKDTEESGTITAISGCDDSDGDTTAQVTDSSKSWTPDQWAGGVLQITSGEGKYRRFDIISNTATALTIQENEVAGNVGREFTICASKHYSNPFPPYAYDLGAVDVGDTYEIGTGSDENGFGNYWNKTITSMTIFDNKLYVSTGLNYEYGAQVWYTENGDTWTVTQPTNSFGNFHTDSNYLSSQKPVSTSIPSLCPSSVSGFEVLYASGTGASGNLGSCSRMAKLTQAGWELIVDVNVDDNDIGTNENGFGDGMSCDMYTGNFMPWSLASFREKLYAGINSLGGARVLYTPTGSSEDGSWFYSVGGDSGIPNGFDGMVNEGASDYLQITIYQNIAVNLFPFNSYLYGGMVSMYAPAMGGTEEYLTGSQIWKNSDGVEWQQVTGNGFGDTNIINFEAFTSFANQLYVSGSKGANSAVEGLGGAKIFRQVPPATVAIKRAHITYHLEKANRDEICIRGDFNPATPIDPSNEEVEVTIVSTTSGSIFSDTIPAGCFRKRAKGEAWFYRRNQEGCEAKVDMMTINLDRSSFLIKVEGENLPQLPESLGDTEDVTIAIRIGNDQGSETNAFRVKKDKKKGIPVKLQFP